MKRLLALFCIALFTPPVWAQDSAEGQSQEADNTAAMQAMMAKVQEFTQPGDHHKVLEKFIGTWNTETKITMAGMPDTPEKGTAVIKWLIDGRWIQTESTGVFLGQPVQSFSMMGYDNFKKSYRVSSVSSIDTAMYTAEGDMDQHGKTLLLYGTVDEYLTGEHDKMVKTVYRLISDDEIVMEIHDLPIGEENTQVLEIRYIRSQ